MSKLKENYFARWGAGLTASGAAYLGAHLLDKAGSPDVDTLASTVEWAAGVGASASTVALALGGIHVYAARTRQKQREKLRASLPAFNHGPRQDEQAVALVRDLRLNDRVRGCIAPIADIGTITSMNSMGFSTEERVKVVADDMVRSLTIVRNQPPEKRGTMADFWFDAAAMGYVLDQVYPIDASDEKTPVTVPGEKHWFDFAEQRAISLAHVSSNPLHQQ